MIGIRPPRRFARGIYLPPLIAVVVLLGGGWLTIRGSESSAPSAKVLESYLAAAKQGDCDRVWAHLSGRTQVLMRSFLRETPMSEADAIRRFCSFSPGTSDLDKFIPGSARTKEVEGTRAVVEAKYKYDRFFGFFGEGTATQRFEMSSESGTWKVDHSDDLDPNSEKNMDEEALRLVYQGWSAERSFFKKYGYMTSEPTHLQWELPGYPFGPILPGVAGSTTPRGTLHVTIASPSIACVSARSGSGTVVMVKIIDGHERELTYQYLSVPSTCDRRPLLRDYPGYSARIIYPE